MKRAALNVFLALLLFCMPILSQIRLQTEPPPPPRPLAIPNITAISKPDEGEVVGHTYSNKFFGLQLTFPEDWFVFSEAGKQAAREAGKKLIKAPDTITQAQIERAEERALNLLTVEKYLATPEGKHNSNFLCFAELLPVINVTPSQYLTALKTQIFKLLTLNYEVEQDIRPGRIDDIDSASVQFKITGPTGISIRQTYNVVIRKGYALGFIYTYKTEEEHDALNEIVNSIKFSTPAK